MNRLAGGRAAIVAAITAIPAVIPEVIPATLRATTAAASKALAVVLAGTLVVGIGLAPGRADAAQPKIEICSACHGKDGNAVVPATPSLAGQPALFIENQLVMIREGLRDVPMMKGMLESITDEDISAIATHYAAQAPKAAPSGPRDEARFVRGRERADALHCGSCHLPTYRGRDQVPRLSGQREDYLLHSMRQFQRNEAVGRDTIMAATLFGVSDADVEALAHYLAHLEP